MDDEQLLVEAGKGRKPAFKELFQKYSSPLLGFIYRLTGGGNEAEELLQETMLRIWTRAPLFDPGKGKARAWMYRIAGRLVINWMEAKKAKGRNFEVKVPEIMEDLAPSGCPGPDETVIRFDEARSAKAALAKLPEDLRMAVTMRHLEGLGIEEIAEIMEIPEGTVKSRIFNGLKKLRDLLGKGESDVQQLSMRSC